MKRSFLVVLIFLFGNYGLYSQNKINIFNMAFDSLELNNIIAGAHSSGILFCHLQGESGNYNWFPKFEYPAGSGKNTIFISNLWIGGLDSNDSIHMAGELYRQSGKDFQPGPISNNYDSVYNLRWNRLWKISKEEVEFHKLNWDQSGYEPIEAIASWPGNGNTAMGQADQLAPYFDYDNDNMYDPMKGDYPLIRGDKTVFFIYNDDIVHTETQGKRLGIELHCMVYGFDPPRNSGLDNSVFVHYDFINRSADIYHDTYIGVFTDLDIGYAWDDYVGCNVGLGSFYGYNGVEIDGNGEPEAYGENPPVQSVTFLAGPFMDPNQEDDPDGGCDFSINGLNFGNGIVDDERYGMTRFIVFENSGHINGTPNVAEEYYNYLIGKWRDSSPMLYGSTHNGGGGLGPECRFMYPGDSDPCNWGTNGIPPNGGFNQDSLFWTEETVYNDPSDRRGVGVTGPITLHPGEVEEVELAYAVGVNSGTVHSAIENLNNTLSDLFTRVENGELIIPNASLGNDEYASRELDLNLFPNPSQKRISLRTNDSHESFYSFRIYNLLGNIMLSGKVNMAGSATIDISKLSPGIYTMNLFSDKTFTRKKFIKIH